MRSFVLSIMLIAGMVGTAFADGAPPNPPAPKTPAPKPIEVVAEPVGASNSVQHSLVPQLSATGLTGGLLAATVISWMKYREYATHVERYEEADQAHIPIARAAAVNMEKWERRTLVLGGATVVSAGVTTFLWLRYNQRKSSVSVQPETGGASVSYVRAF